jgi:hypothetical protein
MRIREIDRKRPREPMTREIMIRKGSNCQRIILICAVAGARLECNLNVSYFTAMFMLMNKCQLNAAKHTVCDDYL